MLPLVDRSTLAVAIKSKIGERKLEDFEFFVYLDEGSNGAYATEILEALSELGVKSIGVLK